MARRLQQGKAYNFLKTGLLAGILLLTGLVVPTLAAPRPPLNLILALDVSGSMRTSDPNRLLPQAARIVVNLLREPDSLGVLSFEDNVQVLTSLNPLTPVHKQKTLRVLQGLHPRGLYTDVFGVLAAALPLFQGPGQKAGALLLLSDGHMDINPAKGRSPDYVQRLQDEIIPAYKKAGIPIYTVAFTPESDQALLKDLAARTGGRYFLAPQARDLHQAFTWLYENLKQPQLAPIINNRFCIDPQVQEMVLIAGRAKPKQAVVLESPDGRRLTYGATSPNVRWFAGQAYDMVTVVKPAPGYWQLSQHTPEEGKVILITDLKLLCPHVPLEPGADEALVVGATLTDNDQPVNNPDILSQTAITGELLTAGRDPVRIELHPPHPEDSSWWPPGTLMGRFPPVLTSGGWRLRVMAQGKTFQREQNYYLNVNSPWYQVELAPQEAGQPYRLICQPHPGRRPENLSAWLNIQSPSGMVTGNLFIPPAGSGFMLPLAPELPGAYLISLQFTGHTPDRRPLVLQPGPWHLDLPDAAASRKSLPLESKESSLKLPRLPQIPWLAFLTNIFGGSALIFLAILIILAGLSITAIVAAVRWRRRGGKTVKVFQNLGGSSETFDVPLEKLNLLLKAQVESLEKERSRLKAALDELQKERDRLFQENSQLSNSLDNQSKTSMDSIKVIGELEQRLQDAETEAKSVQEEYMALFARSQREKDTLKKQ